MAMHNPPHPGELIQTTYMEPFGVSCRTLAMQDAYDLWGAKKTVWLSEVQPLKLDEA